MSEEVDKMNKTPLPTKSINPANRLVQGLGLFGLIAATFNCTVGGGIFRLPASVYQIAGQASPLVYLICFTVMLLVATVFIQVGRHIRSSGGPYAYVQPVLGPYAAYLCGVLLWALATFAMAAVAAAYAGFVTTFIPSLSSELGKAAILGTTFSLLIYFNLRGVKAGSAVSIVLSLFKILPLLALIVLGIPEFKTEALQLPENIEWESLSRAAIILVFAFTGVESALIPSGEIQNPEKNLPRAIYIAMGLVLFLYLGVQAVAQSTLGTQMGNAINAQQSPLAAAAEVLIGPRGAVLLGIGAVLSTLGYLSAITLSLPRSLFSFAQDGFLPAKLAELDPVTHAPKNAIIAQVIVAFLLAASSLFEKLAVLSNVSALLMYSICAIAAIKVGRRWIPILALLSMGALLLTVSLMEWFSVFGVIILASGIYWIKRR
jgi:APA family basic amino acid/polyamine antiporter